MNSVNAERYTGLSAVIVGTTNVSPFTGYTIKDPTVAMLSVEGSAIRYRLDGVTAHSASGHLASAGDYIFLNGSDSINGFNVICTNTTATIWASLGNK